MFPIFTLKSQKIFIFNNNLIIKFIYIVRINIDAKQTKLLNIYKTMILRWSKITKLYLVTVFC